MKAIATKQPTNESVKQNKSGEKGRSRSVSPLSNSQYQVRQTIEEQVWQFVNGQWSLFSGVPPRTVDDPAPELPCWNPPELTTIDTRLVGLSGG
jgi:hypothetical protein